MGNRQVAAQLKRVRLPQLCNWITTIVCNVVCPFSRNSVTWQLRFGRVWFKTSTSEVHHTEGRGVGLAKPLSSWSTERQLSSPPDIWKQGSIAAN